MDIDRLGYVGTDMVSKFQGVCIGHTRYLTGCDCYLLQPECTDHTKKPEPEWVDEGRIDWGKERLFTKEALEVESGPGGDKEATKR